jgi:thiamine-phosphate pyrophosphorylase
VRETASSGAARRRLAAAHLYLVVEARPGGRPADRLLAAALAGGVDVVQLREKEAGDGGVLEAAPLFRRMCDEHGALFVVNDRPDLAAAAGADGVHLGQGDVPVHEARDLLGDEALVGISTHSEEEVDAAVHSGADYFAVGPVFATPTKPGAAPVGTPLVRYAAERARGPFFAIGGIDARNVADVARAGAERIAVVRAIRDADDPRAAAEALRAAVTAEAVVGTSR